MPQKIKPKRSSSASRRGAERRKNEKEQRREGVRIKKPSAPKIISHSVFALTLKDKPGLEVFDQLGKKHPDDDIDGDDDYYRMYKDLRDCFQNGVWLTTGEKTAYDPLMDGLDIGVCLWSIINGFKNNVMPKGFDVRIDKDESLGYYFTIYKDCDFPSWWHAIEVGPVVEFLARTDHILHDIFIRFIAYLSSRLEIPCWYNGSMGYADYMMDEEIENWEDNHGSPEDDEESAMNYESALDEYNSYGSGVVRVYQEFIQQSGSTNQQLRSELSPYDKRNVLVKFMLEALDFMQEPGCLGDYIYTELVEEEGYEGLSFDRQIGIIWDWSDQHTLIEIDAIDSDANNFGAHSPVFHYHFTKHSKNLQSDKYDNWLSWPARFSKLWEKYVKVASSYKKKNKQSR